jgi:hypothetical protein
MGRLIAVAAALMLIGMVPATAQSARTVTCRVPALDMAGDGVQRVAIQVRRDGSCRVTVIGAAPSVVGTRPDMPTAAPEPATPTAPMPARASAAPGPMRMVPFVVTVETPPPPRRRVAYAATPRPQVSGRVQPQTATARPPGPACFVFNGRRYCE